MPEGETLFSPGELGRLEVTYSKRRLEKTARDASLNPGAYEAAALNRKTSKAQIRGVAAAGLARLRQPNPNERTGR